MKNNIYPCIWFDKDMIFNSLGEIPCSLNVKHKKKLIGSGMRLQMVGKKAK